MFPVFCYGSNNLKQLTKRLNLKKEPKSYPAFLEGYERVFRGYSKTWNGGIATIKKNSKKNVYGFIVLLDQEQVETLDAYEGYHGEGYDNYYDRVIMKISSLEEDEISCFVYVKNYEKNIFNKPSEEYLKAICETINLYWRNNDGSKVKPKDIPIK